MDGLVHRTGNFFKKQLISLVLVCTTLLSIAPTQAMAVENKQAAVQTADQTLVKNGGFESGDLSGWTVLTEGFSASGAVVSASSVGDFSMPTNQSGSYHLSGLNSGIPAAGGWAVRSSTFLLSGSGWISVKMGGQAAAVKVFLADGTQVGCYRQTRYHDVNYPYLSQGGSWNDMATYVMNLSEYVGKEMYVVLCDEVIEGKSANALFDDVITYYNTAPDPTFRFDTVIDGHSKLDSASEVRIPWVMGYNHFQPCTENEVENGGFESGDLTGWTILTEGFNASGAVVGARTYWEQELPYNQSGFYHLNGWNTGIPEEQGWAVRSSSFVLGGSGYISVKMGGNAAVTKVFLSDGAEIGYYRNFRFHDVSFPYIAKGGAWADMATYVIDLSDYLGKEMYLELHDEVITDGWANAFFDDVVTYYETAPDVSGRCDKVPDGHTPDEAPRLAQIPWLLIPKVSGEIPRQIPNGNFESGDLTGWRIYGSGFPIKNGRPLANSDETYWEQELPYNKSGNYFVNGSALSSNEANTWRLRSAPFKLEGSGWISVKMGGHAAAVRVYRMDGTLVGDFDQSRFCDKEFPYISKGGSWNDMATYLMDLTPELGEVLYLELCDIPINGGWANAFFDDVVTYYASKPSTDRRQQVADGHKPGENARRVSIPTVVGANNVYTPRNGGFELGDLTGWTVVEGSIKTNTAVVSVVDYNIDADTDNDGFIDEWRKLPYNTSGNYILSGHDATRKEPDTWTIRSSPFTLAGSGYISIKMGGASAAFQVRTAEDDKIIAYCQQRRFNDVHFPYISKGGSWRDMAVYVMDLSDFLGQKLVIELMDEEVNTGWANSYFDDVIAYCPKRPIPTGDLVTDGYKEGIDIPAKISVDWIFLDAFDGVFGRFPPPVAVLKDISGEISAKDFVSLDNYFITKQGLSGYELMESTLTFPSVEYYDGDGGSKFISANNVKDPGRYVVEYKLEQVGRTHTGTFEILVLPAALSNKVFNGGFELGSMAGWTPLTGGFNKDTAVISARTYWAEKLPYNQKGDYHLDGWNTGIPEPDPWAVKSTNFILDGSGYISWRMGGNAAAFSVHKADGTEIAHVRESRFSDTNPPNVALGHWADMTTYVMDLSEFIGDELYVVLHDEKIGESWAHAFFDEVVTYYKQAPKPGRTDIVQNGFKDGVQCEPNRVEFSWIFVKAPTNFRFAGEPSDGILPADSAVDLTAKLGGTTATYGGQPASVEITKVELDGTVKAGDFARFDMSRPGVYQVFYRAACGGKTSPEKSFSLEAYTENMIPNGGFETGDLTGWTVTSPASGFAADKKPVISDETYWDSKKMPYNQAGNYHLGGVVEHTGIAEDDTWSVKSATFTLSGSGYISWRMGGNAAAVKICTADGTQVGYYKNEQFKEGGGIEFGNVGQGAWYDMRTHVVNLSSYLGQQLYIELRDEAVTSGGWAQACFDEVVTYYPQAPAPGRSDTVQNSVGCEPQMANLPWIYLNGPALSFQFTGEPSNGTLLTSSGVDLTAELRGTTAAYGGQAANIAITKVELDGTEKSGNFAQFDMSASGVYRIFYQATCGGKTSEEKSFTLVTHTANTIPNGGFESGDLTGWTVTSPATGFAADKKPVISDATYWGSTKMPYNQKGSYHLDGFPEHTGIVEEDSWTIKSGTFTLGGSGYISVRMGGRAAAVKVYKADGGLVGYYRQTRVNDVNFPYLSQGGSWADMGTYVMDLSGHIGEKLYIELCDEGDLGTWSNAFFDEVVTYYEPAPDYGNRSDTVTDSNDSGTVSIPWQLAVNQAGSEEPEPEIPENAQVKNGGFEDGSLDGWTVVAGNEGFDENAAVQNLPTYWEATKMPYNQKGSYHLNGESACGSGGSNEAKTWAVRSSTFTLAGSGYISVYMGGNAAAVKVYTANGAQVGYYKQTRFSDTGHPNLRCGSWNDMGAYVIDLTGYIGQELYIELCDETANGWAHAFFDEVVTYYKDKPDWENRKDTVANSAGCTPGTVSISWRLAENLYGAASEPVPENAQVANGGFESGDLTDWTVVKGSFGDEAVIADKFYWGSLPYNQAGSFHLDGWATKVDEADTWGVRSSTFTLAGSGYISVRMAGRSAAVKVYQADGTLVGHYSQTRFPNDRIGDDGWADMATYVMDLSNYIGESLYIELWDELPGVDWGVAFFDEVVTYYETAPNWEQKCDMVDMSSDPEPLRASIYWRLAENQEDSAAPLDLTPAVQMDEVENEDSSEAETEDSVSAIEGDADIEEDTDDEEDADTGEDAAAEDETSLGELPGIGDAEPPKPSDSGESEASSEDDTADGKRE